MTDPKPLKIASNLEFTGPWFPLTPALKVAEGHTVKPVFTINAQFFGTPPELVLNGKRYVRED